MIAGVVTPAGIPIVQLLIGGKTWVAVVDSGFNGYLELPDSLRSALDPKYLFDSISMLAAGQSVTEQLFEVSVTFDGAPTIAEATFIAGNEVLLGTAMLRGHRLEIDFKSRTVVITRAR